jgi:hypothetical protein
MNTNNNKENIPENVADYTSPINNLRIFNMESIHSDIKSSESKEYLFQYNSEMNLARKYFLNVVSILLVSKTMIEPLNYVDFYLQILISYNVMQIL